MQRCNFCKREYCTVPRCAGNCCKAKPNGVFPKCHGGCVNFCKSVENYGMRKIQELYPCEIEYHLDNFLLKYRGPAMLRDIDKASVDSKGNVYSYRYNDRVFCTLCRMEICNDPRCKHTSERVHKHPDNYCHGVHFPAYGCKGLRLDNRCDLCYKTHCHLCIENPNPDCPYHDRLCHHGGAKHSEHNAPWHYTH